SGDAPALRFETHTAPEGSSNFIQSARQGWEDFYPPERAENFNGSKTPGEWLERWAADGGAWRHWMFRSAPTVATLIAGTAVAARGLAGAALTPVEIQLYPLVAKITEWKAAFATAVSLSMVSLNLWAMGDRRSEHLGAALLATAFDFGTMLFLGASGLGLISLASRPTKGPAATTASTKAPKSLLRWAGLGILLLGLAWTARAAGMMEGSNPAANVSKTIGADLAAPTPTRTGALPVLGAAVIPFRKARSRVATFPGRRSRSTREVDPEAGTPPVETTVRLRNEGAQWLAEEKASGRFYGVLADWIESSGPGSPHGSRHGTEPAGPFQEAAFNPLTARALRFLAWQTDQALRTRDRGLRPTAEAIRMAYFWGLAGGTPSELPPL
ncbi:MAG TPA: hypothetical protein PK362_11535, partial [Elusimicrobiota bacterium]|nr:hypothetical protein [Elusimicrobiota bacterium]